MLETKSSPKLGESVWVWLIKIISGLLIIIILLIHFLVNHYLAPEGLLSHADVVSYYQDFPIVPIMEAFFLVFVIAHSLIGTRSIVLDLNPRQSFMRVFDGFLVLFGTAMTIYGVWLLFAVMSFGASG